MAKPILHYFDIKGRAESTRLAFAIGGIEFEDKRMSFKDFGESKEKYPFAQLPVLELDGKYMSQSMAMLCYAGKRAKLLPEDDLKFCKVMEVLCAVHDLLEMIVPSLKETDNEKKLKMREVLASEKIPPFLEKLEKLICQNAHAGFSVGDSMTVADLQLYTTMAWLKSGMLDGIPTSIVDKYDNLLKVHNKVSEHPKVKEWNSTHGTGQ